MAVSIIIIFQMASLLSSRLRVGVAVGVGVVVLLLAVIGGVVGWISSPSETVPPQVCKKYVRISIQEYLGTIHSL